MHIPLYNRLTFTKYIESLCNNTPLYVSGVTPINLANGMYHWQAYMNIPQLRQEHDSPVNTHPIIKLAFREVYLTPLRYIYPIHPHHIESYPELPVSFLCICYYEARKSQPIFTHFLTIKCAEAERSAWRASVAVALHNVVDIIHSEIGK